MTITRLWQAGAEFNDELVEVTTRNNANATTSSTKARTGTYSFRTQLSYFYSQTLATTYTQLRAGLFLNHNDNTVTDSPSVFQFVGDSNVVIDLRWDGDSSTLQLYVGATMQDSALSAAFAQTDTWLHVGIDCKIDASGWAVVYLDGIEVLSYTGDTTGGHTSIDTFRFGGIRSSNFWNNYIYYDDLYIDNTAGESAAAPVPDYRFVPLLPNGNGFHDDWVGNDADSTDNYLLVDEVTPDGDTTYVESALSNEEDSYAMTDLSLESGYEVSAVVGMAVAKKLNSGGALDLRITMRTQVGGSPTFNSGSAFALGTDYTLFWRRDAVRPDAGAWDEDTVNDLEIGVLTE